MLIRWPRDLKLTFYILASDPRSVFQQSWLRQFVSTLEARGPKPAPGLAYVMLVISTFFLCRIYCMRNIAG